MQLSGCCVVRMRALPRSRPCVVALRVFVLMLHVLIGALAAPLEMRAPAHVLDASAHAHEVKAAQTIQTCDDAQADTFKQLAGKDCAAEWPGNDWIIQGMRQACQDWQNSYGSDGRDSPCFGGSLMGKRARSLSTLDGTSSVGSSLDDGLPWWVWAFAVTVSLLVWSSIVWLVAAVCFGGGSVQREESEWPKEIAGQVGRLDEACATTHGEVGDGIPSRHYTLLGAVFTVFLSLYMPMNVPIGFLNDGTAIGQQPGSYACALVFASYPLAGFVALPLPAQVLRYVGDATRLTAAGVAVAAAGTLSFGLLGSTQVYQSLALSPVGLAALLVISREASPALVRRSLRQVRLPC